MNLEFRDFDSAIDFGLLAQLWRGYCPERPYSPQDFMRKDTMRGAEYRYQRWVGEESDRPVCVLGLGDYHWAHRPGRVAFDWHMAAADVESALPVVLERVDHHMADDAADEVNAWTRDDHEPSCRLFETQGYRVVECIPMSALSPAEFDDRPYRETRRSLETEGIRFTTAQVLEDEGFDWLPLQYEASWEMVQDIPSPHPPTRITYEHFLTILNDHTMYPRPTLFVALHEGRIVGYSRLTPLTAAPNAWETGLSGTVRSHRRRGIISVLKAMAIATARENGVERIFTDNNDENPMYDLNLRLGFRTLWTWVHWIKTYST